MITMITMAQIEEDQRVRLIEDEQKRNAPQDPFKTPEFRTFLEQEFQSPFSDENNSPMVIRTLAEQQYLLKIGS